MDGVVVLLVSIKLVEGRGALRVSDGPFPAPVNFFARRTRNASSNRQHQHQQRQQASGSNPAWGSAQCRPHACASGGGDGAACVASLFARRGAACKVGRCPPPLVGGRNRASLRLRASAVSCRHAGKGYGMDGHS